MPPATTDTAPEWLSLRNVTAKTADLYLYNTVGELTGPAADTLARLSTLNGATINLRINSPGGNVFAGFAVYNALNNYPGPVIAYVDGIAASIASIIAMAGREIRMAKNAMLMIHSPTGTTKGDSAAMKETADLLEKLATSMRDIYASRSGLSAEQVEKQMSGDTWLTADEAKALGFCTHIDAGRSFRADFDLSHLSNVPAAIATGEVIATQQENMSNTPENNTPEVITPEAVALQVQAATEAAHAAARVALEAATADHAAALDSLRASYGGQIGAKDSEISELRAKLAAAEALSAANLGAPPVNNVHAAGASAPDTSPAAILATYRAMQTGDERAKFFAENKAAIWAAHDAEMQGAR